MGACRNAGDPPLGRRPLPIVSFPALQYRHQRQADQLFLHTLHLPAALQMSNSLQYPREKLLHRKTQRRLEAKRAEVALCSSTKRLCFSLLKLTVRRLRLRNVRGRRRLLTFPKRYRPYFPLKALIFRQMDLNLLEIYSSRSAFF